MTDWDALRKVIAEQDDDYRARYSDEELSETPVERKARLAAERDQKHYVRKGQTCGMSTVLQPVITVPRGTCPKCLKHIGRGVHFHAKACNG